MAFDLIVIGSGPAGYKAALAAARLGAKVAVVEGARLGGTCLNQGCIPSRSLLHAASLIEDVRALVGRGLAGAVAGDFADAVRHKNAVIASIRDGIPVGFGRLGIRLFRGTARFESPARVRVAAPAGGPDGGESVVLEAGRIVVATGSRPRALPECPADGETVVSSSEFFSTLSRLPDRVLCVGGGAVGVEAAYVAHQFGAAVTVVERASRLLPAARVPEHAVDLLERKLERIGVEMRTGTVPTGCRVAHGRARVSLSDGYEGDFGLVLVAVGRSPNTAGIGLDQIGVQTTEKGHVRTNEHLETSARGVYAIGDVRSGPMTASAALYDAKIAVANAIGGERARTNDFKVPFAVHSALEIAAVGLTQERAEAAGFTPAVARVGLGASSKARVRHDYEGFIEVVHDVETGQLLGGCIVGPEAGEQIMLVEAACQSRRGMGFLKDLSYSHPSWCEEIEVAVDLSSLSDLPLRQAAKSETA